MIKTTSMIFNTEMVRALLAGNKTQTRRIIKHQPFLSSSAIPAWVFPHAKDKNSGMFLHTRKDEILAMCPFGKAGDLIAVRETFAMIDMGGLDGANWCEIYKADQERPEPSKWKPSIHMPTEISRLTLKINSVRVERIQNISKEDSAAEGFDYSKSETAAVQGFAVGARTNFRHAWESIYGDSWNKNEWVWVIDFEVIHKNVDLVLAEMEKT